MKKIIAFFIIGIVLILAIFFSGYFYYQKQIKIPKEKNTDRQIEFSVQKGESVKQIGANLAEQNLVRSAFFFKVYIWQNGLSSKLQAGQYLLSPKMNIAEIAQIISQGKIMPNWLKITVPEGFRSFEIDSRLAEQNLIKKNEFLSIVNQSPNLFVQNPNYNFFDCPELRCGLEGFLFPDTYYFQKDASVLEIAAKFLDNFDKKLTHNLREEIKKQNKTIFEIITLASIVQQEAVSDQEMPKIAGVFYNRLKTGMPLESDATINYISGKKDRQPLIQDTKIISPFNTYLNKGLPPYPISNPGTSAIRAAIFYETHSYFYFLHPLNAPTVFSKTLEEHNKNKAEWLK